MRTRSKLAVMLAAAALFTAAVPVLAATVFRGSISMYGPGSAVRETARVAWSYRTGTAVTQASKVALYRSFDRVNWTLVAAHLPIDARGFDLNTPDLADGAYLFRLVADGKIASNANTTIIDNTAPVVSITKPSNGALIIDDASVASPDAVVAGRSSLQAAVEDGTSGVAMVVWTLDGAEIARGAGASHDFGANPGRHTLTATVRDRAGNEASASVGVIALPGQNQLGQPPSPSPLPIPSETPTAPPAPVPTDLPTSLPTPPTVPTTPPNPPVTPPTTPPTTPPSPPGVPTPLPTPTV